MATVSLKNLKLFKINTKPVKTLFFQGKEIPMVYNISFDTNMSSGEYYYLAGQTGSATTVAPPATQAVTVGSAIGSLPAFGNYTYTLDSQSYTIYVEGWYKESSLTNKVTTSWVPTADTKLYAKWKMTGNKTITSGTFVCPKFIYSGYAEARGVNGIRPAASVTVKTPRCVSFIMISPPTAGTGNSISYSDIGGRSITVSDMQVDVSGLQSVYAHNGSDGKAITYTNYDLYGIRNEDGGSYYVYLTMNAPAWRVHITWPALGSGGLGRATQDITATWEMQGSTSFSPTKVLCQYKWQWDNEQDDWRYNGINNSGYNNWYSENWSGTGGNGAYGCTSESESHNHTLTIPQAGGGGKVSGYITLYA